MRTWFQLWLVSSLIVAVVDHGQSQVEGDDRPWWGRAIFAMFIGGVFSVIPGALAVIGGLP